MDILFVVAGLIFLMFGADLLVRGAIALSLRLGVSPLIIGLTVVAMGTSAPELLVSAEAVLMGAPELALGNVIGSNMANILLVLGVPALIAPLTDADPETKRNYGYMLLATALFAGVALIGGEIGLYGGLVFLAGLGLFLVESARSGAAGAVAEQVPDGEISIEGVTSHEPWWRIILFLAFGLAALPIGANMLVDGATGIARAVGVSEAAIGLTLVAVGTSLPELATCVAAALRRETDVAIGNVLGSNIFNLLGVAGVAAVLGTLPVTQEMIINIVWMGAASLGLGYFVFGGGAIRRLGGAVLTAAYVAYAVLALAA